MSNTALAEQQVDRNKDSRFVVDEFQWLTVRQFCEAFPWPSELGIRSIIYRAFNGANPFKSAFRKVGRRVLVSPRKAF